MRWWAFAIALVVLLALLLNVPAIRYSYHPRHVPDSSGIVFYRVDRLTGAVQRFDYGTGRWRGYPATP